MALLEWLIVAAAAFGGLVALMYVMQRSLMYFPERLHTPPAMGGLPEAQEVALDTEDGERVIVWHLPPRGEKQPVVLYFHGNGGALRNRVDRFRALIADGNGLVALSYRGYGGSTGRPTETGLIADAEAAYAFAAARYPAERIVLWGSPSAPASRLRSVPITGWAASCWRGPLLRLPMWAPRMPIGFCQCGF